MTRSCSSDAMDAPNLCNTACLVLCGGQGSRMGGRDKPLLCFQGKAMVDHIMDTLPGQMLKLISANRNHEEYAKRGLVVTDDELPRDLSVTRGPLTGVLAGLEKLGEQPVYQWLLVSPGDTPFLTPGWWRTMFKATQTENPASGKEAGAGSAVVAYDGHRQQQLHLLLHKRLTTALEEYLSGGEVAVHQWLHRVGARQAIFEDPNAFKNINQPEDLHGV